MALTLRDVVVRYGDVRAVDRVSLDLEQGRVLAVLGPSGCGKSTLLRAVAGLEPVTEGSLAFDGRDLARVPTHRRGFALMFQDGQLFAHLSVARNVAYSLRLRGVPAAARASRVRELLDLVGLSGFEDRLPATLSGGERQRVALARALAVEPRLLLLDEPLSALDATLRGRLALDLREILRAAGTTALMVTHDHEEAFTVADEMAVMRAGRIVQRGELSAVWRAPVDTDTALFLGYARVLTGAPAARVLDAAGLPPAPAVARTTLRPGRDTDRRHVAPRTRGLGAGHPRAAAAGRRRRGRRGARRGGRPRRAPRARGRRRPARGAHAGGPRGPGGGTGRTLLD